MRYPRGRGGGISHADPPVLSEPRLRISSSRNDPSRHPFLDSHGYLYHQSKRSRPALHLCCVRKGIFGAQLLDRLLRQEKSRLPRDPPRDHFLGEPDFDRAPLRLLGRQHPESTGSIGPQLSGHAITAPCRSRPHRGSVRRRLRELRSIAIFPECTQSPRWRWLAIPLRVITCDLAAKRPDDSESEAQAG